jgi:hypothetical protein
MIFLLILLPSSMNATLLLLPPPSQWISVSPLSPNPAHFPTFLKCLPRLSQDEKESLEVPFIVPELAAVDELSYEFYHAPLPFVAPPPPPLSLIQCMPVPSYPLPSLCHCLPPA